MKNTVAIILIAFFLSLSINSNAQDASNDATWEETLDFLTEYVGNFDTKTTFYHLNSDGYSDYYSYEIENRNIIRTTKEPYSTEIETVSLKEILNVKLGIEGLTLIFPDNFVKTNQDKNPNWKYNSLHFHFLKS